MTNVAPYDLAKPFDSDHILSYRQIVDLANFDNSVWTLMPSEADQ